MARTLKIKIDGDNSGLKDALDDSEGKLSGFSSKVAGFAGSIAKGGLLIGGAGVVIAGKIGVDSVKAASDLGEALNKSQVIFGSASAEIESWAGSAATALGMSKTEALGAAATFAGLGKAAGLSGQDLAKFSEDLTKRAADVGSFNNATNPEVIEAFGSALRGEAEPARKFNVMLDDASLKSEALSLGLTHASVDVGKLADKQHSAEVALRNYNKAIKDHGAESIEAKDAQYNLDKATRAVAATLEGKLPEALTTSQKTLAAQSLIMRQTTDAANDFGNTAATSLPNKIKQLGASFTNIKATIGVGLLPVAMKLASFAQEVLLPAFERFGPVLAGKVAPILKEVVGGVMAFVAAFKAGDGDITSNGLPGFFERVGFVARLTFDWLKDNVPPVIATIGRIIRDDVIPAVQAFAGWVRDDLWPAAQTVFGWLRDNVPPAIAAIGAVIREDVIPAVQGFADWVQTRLLPAAQEIWAHLTEKLKPIFADVADIIDTKVGPAFSTIVGVLRDDVIPIVKDMWAKFDKYVFPALKDAAKFAVDMWTGMVDMAVKVGGAVLDVITFAGKMKDGITTKFGEAVDFVREFPSRIRDAIGNLGSTLYNAGSDIVQGLIDGIKSKIQPLIDAASTIANAIPGPIKAILDSHSPSRVMMRIGADTMEGFRLGLAGNPVDVGRYVTVPGAGFTPTGGGGRSPGFATNSPATSARPGVGGTVRLIVDGRQLAESALPAIRQLAWAAR